MKQLWNALTVVILVASLAMSIGPMVTGRPVLATVVRSGSMSPVYERGDIALVWNWTTDFEIGDIILFKPEAGALAGTWTIHRIQALAPGGGFLTKGDVSETTDQDNKLAGAVTREQIAAKAIVLFGVPLKIPGIGQVTLRFSSGSPETQRWIMVSAMVLMVLVAAWEVTSPARRRRREKADPRRVFVMGGIIISTVFLLVMILQTTRIGIVYEVVADPEDSLWQVVGAMKPGEVVTKQLARVQNRSFLPAVLTAHTSSENVRLDVSAEYLAPGRSRAINVEISSTAVGKFNSMVELSLLLPVLPPAIVGPLAEAGIMLPVALSSLLPGVVILGMGFLEPASTRRTARDIRRLLRKTMRALGGWLT